MLLSETKYNNLCKLCYDPTDCNEDDRYYGSGGPLKCLLHGGEIAWAERTESNTVSIIINARN